MNGKQVALDLFETHRANYLADARMMAKLLYGVRNEPISTDDIHKHCPIPDGIDPKVMGAVFNKADWVPVGYAQTKRKIAHSRTIRLWVLRGSQHDVL